MPRPRLDVARDADSASQSSDGPDTDSDEQQRQDKPGFNRSLEFPPVDAKAAKRPKFAGRQPKTIAMIREAVEFLDDKKGSAPQSIISCILARKDVLDEKRFKTQFRKAFLKGILDGVLVRTNATKDCEGLSGRVKLAPAKPKPTRKPKNAATKKTKQAPTKDLEAGDQAGEPSAAAAPKPHARPRAPKKAKEVPGSEGEDEVHEEVAASKAKVGRPRRKLVEYNEMHEVEGPKASTSRQKPAENEDEDVHKVEGPKAGTSLKKPAESEDEDVHQVEAPKAKTGRPRKKPLENKEEDVDDPSEMAKVRAGRKKAPSADTEPAHEPEAVCEADQEHPKNVAAAKGRQQPLRSRRNVK